MLVLLQQYKGSLQLPSVRNLAFPEWQVAGLACSIPPFPATPRMEIWVKTCCTLAIPAEVKGPRGYYKIVI